MIKILKLENFQKHAVLELTFKDGLNILYGHTDSGKSSIVRALRWILFDDFNSNEARKQGTKQTVVTVTFDSGISVKRIKSNSINAYELIQGEETKRYDSIGKGIPEDIEKIFGMELFEVDGLKINLNIAEQLGAPFLLGKEYPSTFRAKMFNQLTGNDLQDKVFKELNKDILGFGREITNLEKQVAEHTEELQTLEPQLVALTETYEKIQNTLFFIEDLQEKKATYLSLDKRLTENKTALKVEEYSKSKIKVIDNALFEGLNIQISRLNTLKGCLNDLTVNANGIKDAEATKAKIKVVDLHFDELYGILERVEKLKLLKACLDSNKEKTGQVSKNQEQLNANIISLDAEINHLKQNFTTCPLCDKVIANDEIEKLRSIK